MEERFADPPLSYLKSYKTAVDAVDNQPASKPANHIMASARFYVALLFSLLLLTLSAATKLCYTKITKCCFKWEKCGYKYVDKVDKKKCKIRICKLLCKKVPYSVKLKVCKKVKVLVKCHKYSYKDCFAYKKKCYYKLVIKYKKVCKKVCSFKVFYIKVIKKYKYPKYCAKLRCKTLSYKSVKKPADKVDKKYISVETKGSCKKPVSGKPY